MPDTNVVTSQPVSTANNLLASAPPENVVITQPLNNEKYIPLNEPAENRAGIHVNTYSFVPPCAPNMTEQPVNSDEKIPELTRADAMKSEEEERMRRRRDDYCCYACAVDPYVGDDIFCWYTFWRCYCHCLGRFCEGVSDCTDSFCDGCASCLSSCCGCGDHDGCCGCGDHDGCCDGCCEDAAGDAATSGDGGCCGDGGGDADCDCDCDCL